MAERSVVGAEAYDVDSPREAPSLSIEQQIFDFVHGRSDGGAVLDALYGDTLDELLPSRLTDLLRDWRVS